MEARLLKMESALQTMAALLPNAGGSIHVEDERTHDARSFRGDTAFNVPVDVFNANLAPLREQLGCQDVSFPSRQNVSSPSTPHALSLHSIGRHQEDTIFLGHRRLPFPSPADYMRYLDFIFDDINACHPCLNEAEFRSKCEPLITRRSVGPSESCLLAINYILFACADILRYTGPMSLATCLPGWRWYLAADDIMGNRKINGRGDLSLIQFLVYEVMNDTLAASIQTLTHFRLYI